MSLYLCIFEDDHHDNELDSVEVGTYTYFGDFREIISQHLEHGDWASRFATLMDHLDGDGVWTPSECTVLVKELTTIREEMKRLPPEALAPDSVFPSTRRRHGLSIEEPTLVACYRVRMRLSWRA